MEHEISRHIDMLVAQGATENTQILRQKAFTVSHK
jgi:hypothetical protein